MGPQVGIGSMGWPLLDPSCLSFHRDHQTLMLNDQYSALVSSQMNSQVASYVFGCASLLAHFAIGVVQVLGLACIIDHIENYNQGKVNRDIIYPALTEIDNIHPMSFVWLVRHASVSKSQPGILFFMVHQTSCLFEQERRENFILRADFISRVKQNNLHSSAN